MGGKVAEGALEQAQEGKIYHAICRKRVALLTIENEQKQYVRLWSLKVFSSYRTDLKYQKKLFKKSYVVT